MKPLRILGSGASVDVNSIQRGINEGFDLIRYIPRDAVRAPMSYGVLGNLAAAVLVPCPGPYYSGRAVASVEPFKGRFRLSDRIARPD